ncbi:hypothetical protein TNCV_3069041 [Trichonephila clavipes]|nr:hypothetical protein TNCV_3069041 [Trichonephila clavipes]
MMRKRLAWAKKYQSWTINDSKKIIFSDETHLFEQGYKSSAVRQSETLFPDHIKQTVKHCEYPPGFHPGHQEHVQYTSAANAKTYSRGHISAKRGHTEGDRLTNRSVNEQIG